MIPLSIREKIPYNDEKNGIRYFIQPITGENEDVFLDIMAKFQHGMTNKEQLPILNELFNFLITGWEPITKDTKVMTFPSDGNPARFFNYKAKDHLTDVAIAQSGLGAPEVKN